MTKEKNIPQGYKPSSFGPIPNDWDCPKLSLACWFQEGPGLRHWQFTTQGMKVLNITNLENGIINLDKTDRHIALEEFNKTYKHFGIDANDIVMASSGATYCKTAVVREVDLPLMMNTSVIRFKPLGITDYNYLKSFLDSSYLKSQIDILITGGAQPNFGPAHLKQCNIPLPPLPEQTAIANLLSTWDNAIQTTTALIEQKQNRKKWLMQMLLTGKKRLKGFEKEKWRKDKLENYLVKHDEKTTENNQYPVLTSSRKGIFLQTDYYTREVASDDNTGYNVVPRGFFTYRHMSDDLIFKFNINDIVDKGIVSTLYPVFTVKGINKYYLWYKLNEGNEFKIHALEQKQGGSRTYIYFSALTELKMNLPSIEEQNAITHVLQTADKEIQLLNTKLNQLKEQKKGLMQILLTGKKRLKVN